jgi:WD40 repeat protein
MVETLARAMAAAHQRGIVHRDLKPANVLLQAAEQSAIADLQAAIPKITDFGLAKKLDDPGQTASGAIMGTPSYMAPEQAGSKTRQIGPAADIYALGAILYELLTGRPPFRAATYLDTILQVVSDPPVRPTHLQSKTPKDLETICLKCLAKEPGRRYGSAEELGDDLNRWLHGVPIHARPVGRLERARLWCRRNPAWAIAGSAAILALLLGMVGVSWQWLRAEGLRATAEKDRDIARLQTDLARRHAYAAQMSYAARLWQDDQVHEAVELLNKQVPQPGETDYRGWEWRHLWRLGHGELRTVANVCALALSADGRHAADANNVRVRVWDTTTGTELLSFPVKPALHRVFAFSADGLKLAVANQDHFTTEHPEVRVWDLVRAQELATFEGDHRGTWHLAFSPDGQRLASFDGLTGSAIRVWDLIKRQELHPLDKAGMLGGAFTSNGKLLIAAEGMNCTTWDLTTGKQVAAPADRIRGAILAQSRDGALVAALDSPRTIKVWDLAAGKELRSFQHRSGFRIDRAAFSPDGKRLVTASQEPGKASEVKVWDLSAGRLLRDIKHHGGGVLALAFTPEGRELITSDGLALRFWDAMGESGVRVLTGHRGGVNCVVFSPDSQTLVSAGDDATVRFWEVASGKEMRSFTQETGGHTGIVKSLSFGPDGRQLASCGRDSRAIIWEVSTGKIIQSIRASHQYVGVAVHPDGQSLVLAGGGQVEILAISDGKLVKNLPGYVAALSGDGKWLASSTETGIKVWDMTGGNDSRLFTSDILLSPDHLAFSPDGTLLAEGRRDGTARLWDVAGGRELHVLRGHSNMVTSVAFSPDGQRLATASHDRGVRIWDPTTGDLLMTLRDYPADPGAVLWSVAFSPDGRWLAAAYQDGSIRLWNGQDDP